MEATLSDQPTPKAGFDLEHEKLGRDELLALLHDVTEQRDTVLTQYEAMALQVDEAVREVDEALVEAQHSAKMAKESEERAEQHAAHISELSRELDAERRKRGEIAEELAHLHHALEHGPIAHPWRILRLAVLQIIEDWIAWLRTKIPPESALLPWFDKAVELARTTGRFALKSAVTFLRWAQPHAVASWDWLKREAARRMSKR
ncbi:hypothetical protein OGR47_11535 [Methylocystis sp. MJC1]|uniref:hypothetical protein n=1 Tax=Methylocystis sp. MJC1 TaxID=2654282 RepID=UPI0013EC5EDF|nr:hypothetical protein [Methylocystis sp. MJC1]KAF2990134.1 hypothetical protein MJC1_02794 [Methylocystis sp. MJC1]MBU6527611.1 hypothetical protein [Methylocystis sp. MJC1]UZX10552.1 hypothetical protein OGR47_11535 [Methylocystis sp. MJC1]